MNLNKGEDMSEDEVEILLGELLSRYGYDFRGYSRASLQRRIHRFLEMKHLKNMEELKKFIFSDSLNFERFVQEITVNVTEMFRDPSFYLSLRENVIPMLSTYPFIKIWDAGCSTGEELFSLAIVLEEEGLLHRSKIYATDINQKVLKEAGEGIFSAKNLASYTTAYYASGGKEEFSKYYISNYGHVKFSSALIRNVVFYPHNLATDASFNEFHLIVCRNVLIYFSRELQERVLKLFRESLVSLGYLGLGKKESLSVTSVNGNFEITDRENRIYRKVKG